MANEKLIAPTGAWIRGQRDEKGGFLVWHRVVNDIENDLTAGHGPGGLHMTACGKRLSGRAVDEKDSRDVCIDCSRS